MDAWDWLHRTIVLQAAVEGVLAQPTVLAERSNLRWSTVRTILGEPTGVHPASLRAVIDSLEFPPLDRAFLRETGVQAAIGALKQRRREARGDHRKVRNAQLQIGGLWLPIADPGSMSSREVPENTPPFVERLCWIFFVGATGLADMVVERRVSIAPHGGLACRIVGPGVVGEGAYLIQPQLLGFEARVEAVRGRTEEMPTAAELGDLSRWPLAISNPRVRHVARVHLVAFTNRSSRVAVEFVPVIPEGCQVQWTLTYRWPRIWDSARTPSDGLSSQGFLNFADADEGAIVILTPPRSFSRDAETYPHAGGRLFATLDVDSARRKSQLVPDRSRSRHSLTWSAKRPDRIELEVKYADRGRMESHS